MPEHRTTRAVAHPTRTGAQTGQAERTPQAQREHGAALKAKRTRDKAAARSRRNTR